MATAILEIVAELLPAILALAKKWETTPQQDRINKLNEVRDAITKAAQSLGNTAPIEDEIDK